MNAGYLTYTWTALGDGVNWNDPDNWSHQSLEANVGVPGVPVGGATIIFPPVYDLPTNSPTTIDFNSNYASFPANDFVIDGSYTFQGNPLTVNGGVVVSTMPGPQVEATVLLSGLTLAPRP